MSTGWADGQTAMIEQPPIEERLVPGNALAALLRRPVTVTLGVAWDESVQMRFSLERPGTWDAKKRLEQIGVDLAAADLDETGKVAVLVDSFTALAVDAHGVPGFESRAPGESQSEFGERLRRYIAEADAAWLVVPIMTEYLSETLAPEVARAEQFRP